MLYCTEALSQENLSKGLPQREDSNQVAQLHRLLLVLTIECSKFKLLNYLRNEE